MTWLVIARATASAVANETRSGRAALSDTVQCPKNQSTRGPPFRSPPGGSGAAPIGAVRLWNDWPGSFVRGDNAILLAFSIPQLNAALASSADLNIWTALSRLTSIADIVERDVRVK